MTNETIRAIRKFEIFYDDGEIRAGRTLADWKNLPSTGVQAVVVLHPCGAQEWA